MSLTTELKDLLSPFRRWLDARTDAAGLFQFADELNRGLSVINPPAEGIDRALSGTAYDFAWRWQVGGSIPLSPIILSTLKMVGRRELPDGPYSPEACLWLAYHERAFRDGLHEAMNSALAVLMRKSYRDGADYLKELLPDQVQDIDALIASNMVYIENARSLTVIYNPTFTGSALVGGADADWIMSRALIECKVTARWSPVQPDYILQLLGYALLDTDDEYALRGIGFHLPRQRAELVVPIEDALAVVFTNPDLVSLREDLRECLTTTKYEHR